MQNFETNGLPFQMVSLFWYNEIIIVYLPSAMVYYTHRFYRYNVKTCAISLLDNWTKNSLKSNLAETVGAQRINNVDAFVRRIRSIVLTGK